VVCEFGDGVGGGEEPEGDGEGLKEHVEISEEG
jgi:hypothetical protein